MMLRFPTFEASRYATLLLELVRRGNTMHFCISMPFKAQEYLCAARRCGLRQRDILTMTFTAITDTSTIRGVPIRNSIFNKYQSQSTR